MTKCKALTGSAVKGLIICIYSTAAQPALCMPVPTQTDRRAVQHRDDTKIRVRVGYMLLIEMDWVASYVWSTSVPAELQAL